MVLLDGVRKFSDIMLNRVGTIGECDRQTNGIAVASASTLHVMLYAV